MNKILCVFTDYHLIEYNINLIKSNFIDVASNIFINKIVDSKNKFFLTFSIYNLHNIVPGFILIHRNSEYNVLYTINAINEIIKIANNGIIDYDFELDWSLYNNQLLTVNKKLNTINRINFSHYSKKSL